MSDDRLHQIVIAALLVALVLCVLLLALTKPAGAHDAPAGWSYPFACCANFDCREVPDDWVEEKGASYRLVITGEVIQQSDKRIRISPDGRTHWCAHQAGLDAGKTICLFVPARSF